MIYGIHYPKKYVIFFHHVVICLYICKMLIINLNSCVSFSCTFCNLSVSFILYLTTTDSVRVKDLYTLVIISNLLCYISPPQEHTADDTLHRGDLVADKLFLLISVATTMVWMWKSLMALIRRGGPALWAHSTVNPLMTPIYHPAAVNVLFEYPHLNWFGQEENRY